MMHLSDLTAYAAEKHHITEEHKWEEFPGFSVLSTPGSGKWAALLIRRQDPVTGTETECCDIKCGRDCLSEFSVPFLSLPYRMKGSKWIGVRFDSRTDPDIVCKLFDRAIHTAEPAGFTFVLESTAGQPGDYKETVLPVFGQSLPPQEFRDEEIPEKIREMLGLYDYGYDSFSRKCRNFLTQGRFMQDYEDDAPWDGAFLHYFPTYHDLSIRQLRGYFTWRTKVRRGEFQPICSSLAYIYLYELINGIGAESVEERLEKMKAFEEGYLMTGMGNLSMYRNLRRWMAELCIVNGLSPETPALQINQEMIRNDEALFFLKDPKDRSDADICNSLFRFGGNRTAASPVLKDHEEGRHLLAEIWKYASVNYRPGGKSFFTEFFGTRRSIPWHPFGNAVWIQEKPPKVREYQLDPCRKYSYKDGGWWELSYQAISFDKKKLDGFLHEADRRLRLYLKKGSRLGEKPEEQWTAPYIEAVIEADRQAKIEAAKPKVTIRFSDLDRIRKDALETRDSLLTEEDLPEEDTVTVPASVIEQESPLTIQEAAASENGPAFLPDLDEEEILILKTLLTGGSVRSLITSKHGMASVIADSINEALFDEFGDNVAECDGDEITLVEDYKEDIRKILGEA